jgi:hypothetical protein
VHRPSLLPIHIQAASTPPQHWAGLWSQLKAPMGVVTAQPSLAQFLLQQELSARRKPVLGVPGPSKAAWHSLVLWSQPLFIQAKPGSWHSAMLRTSFQGVARLVRHKALYRSPCLLPRVHLASAFGSSTESLVSSQAAR